jgi:hypothetical protein
MCAGLSLASLPKEIVARRARFHCLGFFAQAYRLLGKALFKEVGLSETATLLHALLHSVRGRRERK